MRTSDSAKRGVRGAISGFSRARQPRCHLRVSTNKITGYNCSEYRNDIVFTVMLIVANMSELQVYTLF
jgi:hypothetical protein